MYMDSHLAEASCQFILDVHVPWILNLFLIFEARPKINLYVISLNIIYVISLIFDARPKILHITNHNLCDISKQLYFNKIQ